MADAKFRLHHMMSQETLEQIIMDTDLLKPEAGLLDPNTLTMPSIKNGTMFTLIPFDDDPTVLALQFLRRSYINLTTKGAKSFMTHFGRVDELTEAVGLLFKEVNFVRVDNIEDMNKLINPPQGEYENKVVKVSILGDLLQKVVGDERAPQLLLEMSDEPHEHDHDHDHDGDHDHDHDDDA